MRQDKTKLIKLSTLALAIAISGGCVTAKPNMGDEKAMAAPAPEKEVAAPAPMMDKEVTSYTVVKNDNLWSISEMEDIYGTPFQWPLIFKANASQIDDADLIFPGQVLDIPRGMSQGEIDAAVDLAKTRGPFTVGGPREAKDQAYLDNA